MSSDRMMEYYYSMGQDCLTNGALDDAVTYFRKAANMGAGEAAYEICAVFDIYSYKKGEPSVRDDRATYWNSEEEGTVRNRYIFDDLMQDILKTFPYRRVPTDIARNLTGDPDRTPLAEMGK